jgi:hypothetical protein
MKRVYKTANGKQINLDAIIAHNEDTIAVGNMKVNARGDQLGPGGKVEIPRDKIMSEYYKLNTPVASDNVPQPRQRESKKDLVDEWIEPITPPIQQEEIIEQPKTQRLRGSLADSVSKNQPADKAPAKRSGPSRI